MGALAENKKAYFDYNILEKIEAGIVLNGQEVKSIKLGRMSLRGAYVVPKDGGIYLIGGHIPAYQLKNTTNYDPERSRKLLFNKKEVNYLIGKSKEKGLTLVPLKVYTRKGIIKIEVGIARGKKKVDKREKIKKRDIDRDLKRSLKS